MRVWTEGSTLRIAALDSDWLKEQVRQQLPTVLAGDRRTLITAPSEAVANFFVRVGADAKAYDEHGEGRGKKVFRRLQ
jgi:hypothetical protein